MSDSVLALAKRIEENIERIPIAGCWIWTGHADYNGYGRMSINNRTEQVTRISFELANGPFPRGIFVLHRCDVPACVNPGHLFLGTAGDNFRDCLAKGRMVWYQTKKTHCPYGHPYDEQNTRIRPNGQRSCRTCQARYCAEYKSRKRANV